MTSGKPWKLYAALEGQPRQLLGAFDTLKEAAVAFREIEGNRSDTMHFVVRISVTANPTGRFVPVSAMPYVIEFFE